MRLFWTYSEVICDDLKLLINNIILGNIIINKCVGIPVDISTDLLIILLVFINIIILTIIN